MVQSDVHLSKLLIPGETEIQYVAPSVQIPDCILVIAYVNEINQSRISQ